MNHDSKIGLCYLSMLIFMVGAFSWVCMRTVPIPWEYWNDFCIFFVMSNMTVAIGFCTLATCFGVAGDGKYEM